jgi:hypothetical protein
MDIDFTKGKWTNPVSKEKVENIQKRAKLWVELREKYPNDEELKKRTIIAIERKDVVYKLSADVEIFE